MILGQLGRRAAFTAQEGPASILNVSSTSAVWPYHNSSFVSIRWFDHFGGAGGGEGEHHSIFALTFTDGIDRPELWWLIVAMLVFTIFIDRAQWLTDRITKGDRCDEMFVQRMNAELMMFGVVAISLFTGQNLFGSVPGDLFILFEFTDIMCSLGACSLIAVGVVLYSMRRRMEKVWTMYGSMVQEFRDTAAEAGQKHVHLPDKGFMDFYIMAAHFEMDHNVPDDFDYAQYMREALSQSICDLININWISWLVLLLISIVGLLATSSPSQGASTNAKVLGFTVSCWLVVATELGLSWYLSCALARLRLHLGTHDMENVERCLKEIAQSHRDGKERTEEMHFDRRLALVLRRERDKDPKDHSDPEDVVKHLNIPFCHQLIQVLALVICFQMALYVMHFGYNIYSAQLGSVWHLLIIVAIVIGLAVNLPFLVSTFAMLEGYALPNPDVLDVVIQESGQYDADRKFVRDQIRRLGARADMQKKLVTAMEAAQQDGAASWGSSGPRKFQKLLHELQINLSDRRLLRLMKFMDENEDGNITVNEFIQAVLAGGDDDLGISRPRGTTL